MTMNEEDKSHRIHMISSNNSSNYSFSCVQYSLMENYALTDHTQPFNGSLDFVRDNLGEPVPKETFTHSHLSWSSIVPYLLHTHTHTHGKVTQNSQE